MMKESVGRALSCVQAGKVAFGVGHERNTSDLHVKVIDLLGNRVDAEIGIAFFVAALSTMRESQPQARLLVLGGMSVQGSIKPVRSQPEPAQIAVDNGAKRALVPVENKRQILELPPDVLEQVEPSFYGDVRQVAFKAFGLRGQMAFVQRSM